MEITFCPFTHVALERPLAYFHKMEDWFLFHILFFFALTLPLSAKLTGCSREQWHTLPLATIKKAPTLRSGVEAHSCKEEATSVLVLQLKQTSCLF